MKAKALTLGLALVLLPSTALAAEHSGGWSWSVEGFYILDFVIFVGLMVWFVKKPAKQYLEDRYNRITAEIQVASRMKAEAEAKLAEVQAKVQGLDAEVRGIRAQFEADGQREKARVLAEAQAQVEKLQANVIKQLEQESAALNQALGQELVVAVMLAAETKVKAKVDQAAQKSLTGSYIDSLEKLESLATIDKAA